MHEYVIDQWLKIEQGRLNYIKNNQKELKLMCYSGVLDWLGHRSQTKTCEKQICILPFTFTGSLRWYQQKFLDGINLVNNLGGGTFLLR